MPGGQRTGSWGGRRPGCCLGGGVPVPGTPWVIGPAGWERTSAPWLFGALQSLPLPQNPAKVPLFRELNLPNPGIKVQKKLSW